jgi:hypothetical protein
LSSDSNPTTLEIAEGNAVPFSFLAENRIAGDATLFKGNLSSVGRALPKLVLDPLYPIPGIGCFNDKSAYSLSPCGAIGYGKHDRDICIPAGRDKLLDPRYQVVIPIAGGGCLYRRGI